MQLIVLPWSSLRGQAGARANGCALDKGPQLLPSTLVTKVRGNNRSGVQCILWGSSLLPGLPWLSLCGLEAAAMSMEKHSHPSEGV